MLLLVSRLHLCFAAFSLSHLRFLEFRYPIFSIWQIFTVAALLLYSAAGGIVNIPLLLPVSGQHLVCTLGLHRYNKPS